MGITGIGSQSSYYYDLDTKKLVSKQKEDDAFVKWFNGEITEEELPDEFNGFDQCKKSDLEDLFDFIPNLKGLSGIDYLQPINEENQCEISINIVDADTSEMYVNGKKLLIRHKALDYCSKDIREFHFEKGYSSVIPQHIYERALKSYEEQLNLPLYEFNCEINLAEHMPNASADVRRAYAEAMKETGFNENELMGYLSQMYIREVENRQNGISNPEDVFGESVESALKVAKEFLYQLENSLFPIAQRGEKVAKYIEQEKAFYRSFIERLENEI